MDLWRLVADEDIQAAMCDDRADRMDARATVLADRREIAESDAELVEKSPSGLGHVRLLGRKLAPTLHGVLSVHQKRRVLRHALLGASAAQRPQ